MSPVNTSPLPPKSDWRVHAEWLVELADRYQGVAVSYEDEDAAKLNSIKAALAQPDRSRPADLPDVALAMDTIAAMKAGKPIDAPGIQAIVALAETGYEQLQQFDLRWDADMRAIKRWKADHEGRALVLPDHCDLVVWLLELLDRSVGYPPLEDVSALRVRLAKAILASGGNPLAKDANVMIGALSDALLASERARFILDTKLAMTTDHRADALAMINHLRREEADLVSIASDNPDEGPANVVICSGAWTGYAERRFEGDSLIDCLTKAMDERIRIEREGYPDIAARLGDPTAIELLDASAALFREYEKHHLAKIPVVEDTEHLAGTVAGVAIIAEANGKAARNGAIATRIEAYLANIPRSDALIIDDPWWAPARAAVATELMAEARGQIEALMQLYSEPANWSNDGYREASAIKARIDDLIGQGA